MKISLQQLIAILPMLIIVLTITIVMLSIAWRRNHSLNALVSVLGLNFALASLWFVRKIGDIDITPLIHVDSYAILYSGLGLLSSIATCVFAYPWLKNFFENKEEFYLLVLIASLGSVLLSNTNHLASLYLGIELLSLPLFGLIGYSLHQEFSLKESIKYTILSATASSFLLFGIALSYIQFGDLSFMSFGKNFDDKILHGSLILVSLGLMIIGLSFKLSLVPFHLWTPDVYHGAPSPVSTFLSTTVKIAVFSVLMRLLLYVSIKNNTVISLTLSTISFISIIFGNLMAVNQTNIKRLLGCSSISHLGYLLIVLVAFKNVQISIETAGIYLLNYLFSNLGIFGIVNLLSNSCCSSDPNLLAHYRGLFWNNPILSMIMTIIIFSLAGIPITLGFISKFYILALSIQENLWWLTITIIVGSIIGLYYYFRVIINLYINTPQQFHLTVLSNWQYSPVGIIVLFSTFFILIFGVYPQPLISVVRCAMPTIIKIS